MHWKNSSVLAPPSVLALTALVGCGGSAAASPAKGYQSISAPGNGITLEVPKDFVPMQEKSPTAEVQYAGPVDAGTAKDGQGRPNILVLRSGTPSAPECDKGRHRPPP